MVHFIAGGINSGKTTKLISVYEAQGGEGFAMIKTMAGDRVHSYRARRLSTGEEQLLVLRDCWLTEDFDEACRIGPYCFSGAALDWIEVSISDAIEKDETVFYLDEIGVLELEGKGYCSLLTKLADTAETLYLTAREDLVPAITQHFGIDNYDIATPESHLETESSTL